MQQKVNKMWPKDKWSRLGKHLGTVEKFKGVPNKYIFSCLI